MANEKRLIDANEVLTGIATFKECYEGVGLKPWVVEHIQTALQMVERFVKETPTVDAVEVVRCKICIHRHTRPNCQGRPMDFFCADGERTGRRKDNG